VIVSEFPVAQDELVALLIVMTEPEIDVTQVLEAMPVPDTSEPTTTLLIELVPLKLLRVI
jgi:hypothetical protein